MTFEDLAKSYLKKAKVRFEMLKFLYEREAYSDVIREAQEAVELTTKAMLRQRGIEPPKYHEVSFLFFHHKDKFPEFSEEELKRMSKISKSLRKERELSLYGDIDFIPTEEYTAEEAKWAIEGTEYIISLAERIIKI
ncbi:MAG: HEPN domain-containing protein [Thermodesulfobacteriaceae bacterium]|nr:HEPN domain-containing protein [Thermodesulfobacteriaceae bacterium]MCX8042444.1 HEPN domain-containing protein [Thermodesulfobacteriaceae bacterium]MDW8136621.1 HEPN domain-containing protein [Thermodesulfobacterium sp.]